MGAFLEKSVSLTNDGTGALTVGMPTFTGTDFSVSSNCPTTLAPAASCDATVRFEPTAAASRTGTLTFLTNATNTVSPVSLSGTGVEAVGSLTANTSASFGDVSVGAVALRVFTFTNTGSAPAEETFAQVSGTSLTISSTSCGTSASRVTIAAGDSCQITVQYAPTAEGTLNGTLTVTSTAKNSPSSLALTGTAKIVDNSASNVSFLLHADTALVDSGKGALTITAFGDAKVGTTLTKFGGGAVALDGSGDYLQVQANTGFGFGTGDFTIEAWVYLAGSQLSAASVLDFRTSGAASQPKPTIFGSGSGLKYYVNGSTPAEMNTAVTLNTWHHVAYSRSAGIGRFFVDGVQIGSNYTDNVNYGTSADLVIGQVGDNRAFASGYLKGAVDEVRITKGVARYTANFPVPSAPFPNP